MINSVKSNQTLLAILAITLTSIIWGITTPLTKVNLGDFPPMTLAFLRFTLASFLCLIFSDIFKLKLKDFFIVGIYAFFGVTLNLGLWFFGLQRTTAIDATVLSTLTPIITSLLAVVAIREKIQTSHFIGIMLSFAGALLYTLYPLINGNHLSFNLVGYLLILGSIIASAIYIVGSKKLFETYSAINIATISFIVGAITFFPGSLWETSTQNWLSHISAFNIFSLLFFVVASSFIAYLAQEWSLTKIDVHTTQAIGYVTPVISVLISYFFLHEKLNNSFVVSAALIVLGVVLVAPTRKKLHHHFHRRNPK